MKVHIPNTLTLGNLICGCTGIVMAFSGNLEYAGYLIWIAAVFDFFDGFAARMLKVKSSIGKELDSLADMVSFGILPACIMYVLVDERTSSPVMPFFVFSIAVFSALRLAKFNVDENQEESFIGLPTPANAFFISALPLILINGSESITEYLSAEILVGLSLVLSLLLVSKIPMFSLKFKDFSWQHNTIRYTFAILSLVLLFTLKIMAIPLIIGSYILYSIVISLFHSTK